ncbi:unnamed protein product [Fusarium graminearum]|uniref:Chromosome 4, complete genome n=1 Tax=Gibberella zeae (strain ATCC MYA-4620 / CBS 123657 / FGSC 9075 / NRRL 31084 / PH-1) TaxID=229533 RepID=I1S9V4_GIBZE|nr:hypothetical protein FGSG_13635 [Fusarium graminearum PH-1]ESU16364.1 hypothetical protein FGSG_13635 [Fusarium graminearum PH-1]CEF82877.1 unnamed protein product [Fusarium graminearum]CZS74100.1 unnamed protein product [Fusarium graminearum]|eukprot:XP_011327952.1 hypothetical protein FGSG_13635 [Fusarium graminearum PH-1]
MASYWASMAVVLMLNVNSTTVDVTQDYEEAVGSPLYIHIQIQISQRLISSKSLYCHIIICFNVTVLNDSFSMQDLSDASYPTAGLDIDVIHDLEKHCVSGHRSQSGSCEN